MNFYSLKIVRLFDVPFCIAVVSIPIVSDRVSVTLTLIPHLLLNLFITYIMLPCCQTELINCVVASKLNFKCAYHVVK